MKKLQKKGFLSITPSQYKNVDLGQEDEMEIKEDNFLISYNPTEAISNNIIVEVIQEGSNYLDFKTVLEKYKDIQFKNRTELI